MPVTPLGEMVDESFRKWGMSGRVAPDTDHHDALVERVAAAFQVSRDAAKLRLSKLGYLSQGATKRSVSE